MSDYSRTITPICCHAYRVNRVWEEAENRWVNRLTIEPQIFCSLKEIELKTRKIQRKNQQCVTIMQSRLANKNVVAICPVPDANFTRLFVRFGSRGPVRPVLFVRQCHP